MLNGASEIVREVCRIGRGAITCRYLVADESGFHCAKLDEQLARQINERQAAGSMIARGDNCTGFLVTKIL